MVRPVLACVAFGVIALSAVSTSIAQTVPLAVFNGLHWRLAGPFRGGRALAVTGVPGSPEKFYFGAVGGGVWVTENAGRTWNPIFDQTGIASIGAIAVSPSDPNTIYVGTGEADMRSDIQQGDGIYKSTDAGKTWTHIGLKDTRQIGKILVDPHDPNTVYVAALGHQYGPNSERGVFKTTDGGQTWAKVLYKNEDTGAIDLDFDPTDSKVIYASVWQTRRPPWSIYPPSNGPGSGLYKTTDGGVTWKQIMGDGFPAKVGRIGISVSPANHNRVYTCVDGLDPKEGGVYRSDDAGATWIHIGTDSRIWGRGWYFMGITADPKNPDLVYVMNTSSYRSTNAGKTWTAFKGAPGGDDYHTLWIQPDNPKSMILGCDQGVVVSVDSGKTWSSWYNQPTGQFYHIVTDNRFPYWIYGSQQDSGAMSLPSRTIHTGISALYQRPIDAGGESGTIAPDPLHPGMLYSSTGSKEDFETGWEQNIDPTMLKPGEAFRSEWTMPIANSPANPHVFYTSHQQIFRTQNGGSSWKVISPDLTRKKPAVPNNLDPITAADNDGTTRRGVVYWLAPSPIKATLLWAGTDDGLIWVTSDDGKHWRNVTPPALDDWSKVGVIEAGRFSTATAYAAIDRHRLDDNKPYIYRTHDGGAHWKLITSGLPADQFVNVVREDPRVPNLLYAGTDWGIFISFNDGESWQPFQLNLPPASVRDIVFGGNDVVVGTHGRAIWILDNVAILRQLAAGTLKPLVKPDPVVLFQRAGTFGFGRFDEGTPLPPEEPQGENAPWGAILDYVLDKSSIVTLKVFDANGQLLREITSIDPITKFDPDKLDIPAYWIEAPKTLGTEPGGHRFLWDLRTSQLGNPLVPPGQYKLSLTADGKTTTQPLTVTRDPRLSATTADLIHQYNLAVDVGNLANKVKAVREQWIKDENKFTDPATQRKLRSVTGGNIRRRRRGVAPTPDITSLAYVEQALEALVGAIESAQSAPTIQYLEMFETLKSKAKKNFEILKTIKAK